MTSPSVPAHGESKPHAAHATVKTYLTVFIWLAVFTAIEVAVTAVPMSEMIQIGILVALAVIKAALVVLYYMHLRYDSFWYWIILLVPVFFVMLLTRYLIIR